MSEPINPIGPKQVESSQEQGSLQVKKQISTQKLKGRTVSLINKVIDGVSNVFTKGMSFLLGKKEASKPLQDVTKEVSNKKVRFATALEQPLEKAQPKPLSTPPSRSKSASAPVGPKPLPPTPPRPRTHPAPINDLNLEDRKFPALPPIPLSAKISELKEEIARRFGEIDAGEILPKQGLTEIGKLYGKLKQKVKEGSQEEVSLKEVKQSLSGISLKAQLQLHRNKLNNLNKDAEVNKRILNEAKVSSDFEKMNKISNSTTEIMAKIEKEKRIVTYLEHKLNAKPQKEQSINELRKIAQREKSQTAQQTLREAIIKKAKTMSDADLIAAYKNNKEDSSLYFSVMNNRLKNLKLDLEKRKNEMRNFFPEHSPDEILPDAFKDSIVQSIHIDIVVLNDRILSLEKEIYK